LNWHVIGIALALALATGLLFDLAPALQATRVDLVSSLKDTRAGQPRLRWRGALIPISLSQILVVGRVATCVLLLVAAGLFVHTLSNLNSIQLGFNRENVLLFSVKAKQAGYRDQALVRYYQNLQSRLASMPGVRSVTASSYAMVSESMSSRGAHVLGVNPGKERSVAILGVAGSFFATMQMTLAVRQPHPLPQKLQAHLPDTGIPRASHITKLAAGEIPVRVIELSVVEKIEELRPELQRHALPY
jgi:hypothetical protein